MDMIARHEKFNLKNIKQGVFVGSVKWYSHLEKQNNFWKVKSKKQAQRTYSDLLKKLKVDSIHELLHECLWQLYLAAPKWKWPKCLPIGEC